MRSQCGEREQGRNPHPAHQPAQGPVEPGQAYTQGVAGLAAAGHQEGTPCRSSLPTSTSPRSRQARQGWRRSWLSMIRACRSPPARNGHCVSLSRTSAGRTGGRPRSRVRGLRRSFRSARYRTASCRMIAPSSARGCRPARRGSSTLCGKRTVISSGRSPGRCQPVSGYAGWHTRRWCTEPTLSSLRVTEPEPVIAAEVAADAIDEWLMLLASGLGDADERTTVLPAGAGLHIHATDDGLGGRGEWMIRHDAGGLTVEPGHGKGDAALSGPAVSLLLVLMRRRPVSDPAVTVYGHGAVVDGWLASTAF